MRSRPTSTRSRRRRRVGRHRRAQAGEVDGADARRGCDAPGAGRRRRGVRLPRRPGPAGAAGAPAPRAGVAVSAVRTSRAACGGATRATTRGSCGRSRASTCGTRRPRDCAAAVVAGRRRAMLARARRRRRARGRLRRQPRDRVARRRRPWVFARAADGAILERHWTGSGVDRLVLARRSRRPPGPPPSGYGTSRARLHPRHRRRDLRRTRTPTARGRSWTSLGGYATSAPAAHGAPRAAAGYVDVAVKGGDNAIWLRTYVPGRRLVRVGLARRQPDVGARAQLAVRRRLNVWARGTDGARRAEGLERRGVERLGQPRRRDHRRAGRRVADRERRERLRARRRQRDLPARAGRRRRLERLVPARRDRRSTRAPAAGGDAADARVAGRARRRTTCLKEWNGELRVDGWSDLGTGGVPTPPRRPPAPTPAPDGELALETGLRCTPPGGRAAGQRQRPQAEERQARRACRGSSSSPRARTARSAWTARRRSWCGSGSTARPAAGPRLRPRLLPPLGEGQAAPQDGFPPLHGLPLASLPACPTTSVSSGSAGSACPLALSFADAGLSVLGVDNDAERLASLRERRMPFKEPGTDELIARVDARPLAARRRRREGRRDRAHARHARAAPRRDRHGRDPRRARRPAAGPARATTCSCCARPSRPGPPSSSPATSRSSAASASARTCSSPTCRSGSPPTASWRRSARCRASSAAWTRTRPSAPPGCSSRSAPRSCRRRRCRPSWRRSGPTSCATRRSRSRTC